MQSSFQGEFVAASEAGRGLRSFIEEAARSAAPVLLLGEPGTGKELAARAIHFASARRSSPFLMVDCSLFYERELERELFGYLPAAGEPAEAARKGLLEFAPRGTCYSANVEELSPSIQQRLLNYLDTGYLQAVGSSKPAASKMRLIFSSEKNLAGLSQGGLFSEDLFRRFSALTLRLSPLRERPGDVAPLVHHFSERFRGERSGSALPAEWSPDAIEALSLYPWPGNIDELRSEIYRLLRAGHRRIAPDLLATPIVHHWKGRRADPAIAQVLEELHGCIQEFKVMSRLDAEYGDVLLDVADWDVVFKAHER